MKVDECPVGEYAPPSLMRKCVGKGHASLYVCFQNTSIDHQVVMTPNEKILASFSLTENFSPVLGNSGHPLQKYLWF